jgi:hypothetical protein
MRWTTKLKRMLNARHAYYKHPSREGLRIFMHYKALLGRRDHRQFAYYGKNPNVVLGAKDAARRMNAAWLVVTSTTDGAHAPGSYHAQRKAVDGGLIERLIGTSDGLKRLVKYQRAEFRAWQKGKRPHLIELLGPDNNACVLNGHATTLVAGSPLEIQHNNHVHEAFSR